MTSIGSRYAKRLSRALQTHTSITSLILTSDLATWLSSNSEITQLGNAYIVSPSSEFADIAYTLINGATGSSVDANITLRDLGKEVYLGISKETPLIILRLVQLPGKVINNGTPDKFDGVDTGYVVVANNTNDPSASDFKVHVSRV